jgi:DNA-binding LytR/AlgR family response regulator
MRIAICDDISLQIELIKSATEKYFSTQNDNSIEIDTFDNAFHFIDAHEKEKYDLVLLDIFMPGMLGTDVAREIRMKMDKIEIIFLTTSNEFAVDAFQVNATHYLLKPFTQEAFTEAMDRAMHNINTKLIKMVYLKCPKGVIQVIDKNSISYIEGSAHKQYVFIMDGTIVQAVQTLSDLAKTLEELSQGQFITPYKGFIVNQHAISAIESDKIVLKSGKSIPIPRRTFNLIKQVYFNYMFGGSK